LPHDFFANIYKIAWLKLPVPIDIQYIEEVMNFPLLRFRKHESGAYVCFGGYAPHYIQWTIYKKISTLPRIS